MAKEKVDALGVGKWTVGYNAEHDMTILSFEWTDRPAINLAVPRKAAIQIATSILEQLKTH